MSITNDVPYRLFPQLASYIDRIGAEQLNFKRFMVREHRANGYYHEKCMVYISGAGDITVSDREWAPTKEEAEAIKAELASAEFPKWVATTRSQFNMLKKQLGKDALLYEFIDRAPRIEGADVLMVQQRIQLDNGDKRFRPWTYWSDGHWRAMEPERNLPFWKPVEKEKEDGRGWRLMIHEGPKTARFVHELCNDPRRVEALKRHPFGHILKEYQHWGIIGGALAPHRSEYGEIHAVAPSEVVYVCDNDFPGKSALQKVSKCYGSAMKGVVFDERWPVAFDLGDDIPEKMFGPHGNYIGPRWDELIVFATRATKLFPTGEKGRPQARITDAFSQEWYHSIAPEVYVHRDWPALVLGVNEFNNKTAPYSDVDDTARLLKKEAANKSAVLSYNPALKDGIYAADGGRYINTHVGCQIKPIEGDVSAWLDFLEYLVPDPEDRKELIRWCATLIASPQTKMLYGVLMISEAQGIGKGTLGEKILAPLVGELNVSYPSESEIVESNFNYWSAHKRLAVVHEIYAGHSAKAYNTLKSTITDRYLTVSKKYQANYEIENWIHVFACSNSMRAIQLSMDDRRWFVPKLTEAKRPSSYWQEFNRWLTLDDGLAKIRHWAFEWIKNNAPVMKGDSAPWSAAKKEIIEEGYSPGMNAIGTYLDYVKHCLTADEHAPWRERLKTLNMITPQGEVVLCDKDLVTYISHKLYEGRSNDRIEKPATIRKVAKARGWAIGEEKVGHWRWGRDRIGSRLIATSARLATVRPSDLGDLVPMDVALGEAL